MPKFTPEPWIADDGDADNWGVFSDATSDAVCYLHDTHNGAPYATDPLQSSANAHLIAAAPEMHAKLDKLATWLERNAALKESWIKTCRFESINDEERANAKNFRATAADIRRLLAKADGEE